MEEEPATPAPDAAQSSPAASGDAPEPAAGGRGELATSAADLAATREPGRERIEPIIYRGSDRQVRVPPAAEPVKFLGEDVSLNFEQAPLSEVMHAIMGDILKLDYVVDLPVQGNITLRTRTPIPRDELLGVLESLLKANGALMIRGTDGRYLVTGSQQGTTLAPGLATGDGEAGYSTVVIPLQYISAGSMAEILQPLATEDAFVRVDNRRNILMLAGTRRQIEGWMGIINTFDVDQLAGMSVGLFPLENSGVDEVAEALSSMLDSEEDGGLVRVIPVKRLNSVLLVTSRSHYLDTLGVWIERLDSLPDSRFEKRLHVYPVQNTSATRLAELLNSIYAGDLSASSMPATTGTSRRSSGGSTAREGGVAPGMSAETLTEGGSGMGGSGLSGTRRGTRQASNSENDTRQPTFSGADGGSDGDYSALENVRVVADDDNNALMIYATGKQYDIIMNAVRQLDVVPTQVIIEASILEVTLTDQLKYGLEWTFKNGIGNYDGQGTLVGGDSQLDGALATGFNYIVTKSAGDIRAVLNALSSDSLLNVISTPSVMVLDNHTAYIHVGNEEPIIDQQSTSDASDTSRITQSITYRDTGVRLEVTPSVNAGGLVTMDVFQSISQKGEIDEATGQNTFGERTIQSRVAVRSGEPVVLGGLIAEEASDADAGIPVLHKLPLVGSLFGSTTQNTRRTELLVIITPRALYNENELREVSDEMRSKIRHMELIGG
jgi:general secretion pathway protein D